jgi:hypothetical protein
LSKQRTLHPHILELPWQAKTGGTLWGKTFIPFGREGDMGDAVMTAVFQQQSKYLQEATQRIVQNLADIDEIIEIDMNLTNLWKLCRIAPEH